MKKALTMITVPLLPFLFTSCGTGSYAQQKNTTNTALVGAVAGGIIGHQSGHALEGAAIGAVAGGLAGHALTPQQPTYPRYGIHPPVNPYAGNPHPGCGN